MCIVLGKLRKKQSEIHKSRRGRSACVDVEERKISQLIKRYNISSLINFNILFLQCYLELISLKASHSDVNPNTEIYLILNLPWPFRKKVTRRKNAKKSYVNQRL